MSGFLAERTVFCRSRGHPEQFSFDPSSGSSFRRGLPVGRVFNYPGASPSVSSQGASNGIVWAIEASQYGRRRRVRVPAVLHAYDAGNLMTILERLHGDGNRGQAGSAGEVYSAHHRHGKCTSARVQKWTFTACSMTRVAAMFVE